MATTTKKYLFTAALTLTLFAAPLFTQAASLTGAQVSAIIQLLQSFGADSATIASVTAALEDGGTNNSGNNTNNNGGTYSPPPTYYPPVTGGAPFCHAFNTDIGTGSSGPEVVALTQALALSGINVHYTTYFDQSVANGVAQFQGMYGITQTGYVGSVTRSKLNSLYGCSVVSPNPIPNPTPTPSPVLKPLITVVSPNGGESFRTGDIIHIEWSSSGVDTVSIGYSNGPGSMIWIAQDIPNTGSYDWVAQTNDAYINPQFRIGIVGYKTNGSSVSDYSDNYFWIQ